MSTRVLKSVLLVGLLFATTGMTLNDFSCSMGEYVIVVMEGTLTPPEGEVNQETIDISVWGYEGIFPHTGYPSYTKSAELKRRTPSGEWPNLAVSYDWVLGPYYDDDANYINWDLDELTITFHDVPIEPGENVFKIAVTSKGDHSSFDGAYGEMEFTYTRPPE